MGECHRPNGYYLRGPELIPGDADGKPIPEAEWLDADYERIKGHPRAQASASANASHEPARRAK